MPVRRRFPAGRYCSALVLLAACTSDPQPVASVVMNPESATVRVGGTTRLVATPFDADGTPLVGRTAAWVSADPSIATVNEGGFVSGVASGATTVTATIEGISADASVGVGIGVTGAWSGSVTPNGGAPCPMTQSLTEASDGSVTGSGTLTDPCDTGSYSIAGNNGVGGVVDSVVTTWSGPATFTLMGSFDGGSTMTGFITGGSCGGTQCPFSFTRSSMTPAARGSDRLP